MLGTGKRDGCGSVPRPSWGQRVRAPCSVPHSPSSFSKPTGSPIQHEVRSTAQWSPVLNASRSQLPWASPCHLLHSDALQRCQLSESDQRFVRCQPLEASPGSGAPSLRVSSPLLCCCIISPFRRTFRLEARERHHERGYKDTGSSSGGTLSPFFVQLNLSLRALGCPRMRNVSLRWTWSAWSGRGGNSAVRGQACLSTCPWCCSGRGEHPLVTPPVGNALVPSALASVSSRTQTST